MQPPYRYNVSITPAMKACPYDSIAIEYDSMFGDGNPYYRTVNRCERELFASWVTRPNEELLALDVGCGTGFHTQWLIDYGFRTTAIDASESMVRMAARKRARRGGLADFKVMDVADLGQLRENCYRVVFCLGSSLNHFNDWRNVARLIAKRMSPGGMFFFSYDNVDGIDVLARVLLRQFSGYGDAYVREILLGRMKARIMGESFSNHWCVRIHNEEVQIPLKYESTARWRGFLDEAGLEVREMRGAHLLDCFDGGLLEASAGVNLSGVRNRCGRLRRLLNVLDQTLASRLHFMAAQIVGIAVKR